MIIRQLAKLYASVKHTRALQREKKMGYKLVLNNLSPGWIDATHIYDMTQIWNKAGLDAEGVNYFTIGNCKDGLSTRYNPSSKYYQAWFGGYIVHFPDPRSWKLDDHFALCVADQKNWLRLFGDKEPFVEIDFTSVKKLGALNISGFRGKLYYGGIWSDTDVGNGNKSFTSQFIGAYEVYQCSKSNPKLNLSPGNFIPRWNSNDLLTPYQKIYLTGLIAIVVIDDSTKAVLYANGATYTDRNGKKHDMFKKLNPELKSLLKQVEIIKV